jgi:hypothetical protein
MSHCTSESAGAHDSQGGCPARCALGSWCLYKEQNRQLRFGSYSSSAKFNQTCFHSYSEMPRIITVWSKVTSCAPPIHLLRGLLSTYVPYLNMEQPKNDMIQLYFLRFLQFWLYHNRSYAKSCARATYLLFLIKTVFICTSSSGC